MTNTPMTFEEWVESTFFTAEFRTNHEWMKLAWQASQAQQAQTIAELVEALEMWAGLINYQYTGSKEAMSALQICDDFGQEVLAKVKGK